MKDKKDPEEVARIRKLLKHWDDGDITPGEFEIFINRPFKETLFECIRNGEPYGECQAGCWGREIVMDEKGNFVPSEPEKVKKFNVEVELFPGGFWIRPLDKK